MEWYQQKTEEVLKELNASLDGLSEAEARGRLEKWGANRLTEAERESRLKKFAKQFTEFIILVLIGSAVIAGVLGEWVDSLAIMSIVVLNGVIGFIQEERPRR